MRRAPAKNMNAAKPRGRRAYRLAKRALDLGLGLPLVGLTLPLSGLIALAIKLDSPGPVFFGQWRRGEGFEPIYVLKFRSLRHGAPDPYEGYEMGGGDPRVTRVGALLRRASLDELPQLLNVVRGEMSLVGPRPLDEWESQRCRQTHPQRFDLPPGLTGLAQVSGRNALPFARRADLDVAYAEAPSILRDLGILARTPWALLTGDGLYPRQEARADETRWGAA